MSRPYTQTEPPREWARKKILDLEEAVAALKTRVDEQGAIIDALKAQRPSRFLDKPATGIDWAATKGVMAAEAEVWVEQNGGQLKAGSILVRKDLVDLFDSSGTPLLKLSQADVWMLNRFASYPRVPFEEQLEDLKAAGVTDKGRELGLRLIYENETRTGLTLREHTLLKRYFALLHRVKARV